MSPGVENKIMTKEYFRGGKSKKVKNLHFSLKITILRYVTSAMAYIISESHPESFFLAAYQMSPGVENKISTQKYIRVTRPYIL